MNASKYILFLLVGVFCYSASADCQPCGRIATMKQQLESMQSAIEEGQAKDQDALDKQVLEITNEIKAWSANVKGDPKPEEIDSVLATIISIQTKKLDRFSALFEELETFYSTQSKAVDKSLDRLLAARKINGEQREAFKKAVRTFSSRDGNG